MPCLIELRAMELLERLGLPFGCKPGPHFAAWKRQHWQDLANAVGSGGDFKQRTLLTPCSTPPLNHTLSGRLVANVSLADTLLLIEDI